MKLFTIGFTRKTAQTFFSKLKAAGVRRIVDVRLNNVSQLAGFAKKNDLRYFLKEICDIEYVHAPELAPTQSMLDEFKKGGGDWAQYERQFLNLMRERKIEESLSPELVADGCLLCSEDKPHHCHRRLVAEYLKEHWRDVNVAHLF
jgi:uncharacterized protein (DUF488 family)